MNTELLLPLLGEWLAKGVAILLVAASIVHFWRRSSAAQRHFVWLAALTTLLLLPATRLVAPRWTMSLERPVKVSLPLVALAVTPVEANLAEPAPRAVASTPTGWRLPGWRILLGGIWGAGAAGLLGYRWLGSWRLRRIEKAAECLDDAEIVDLAQGVFREIGIRQVVTVRISRECRVPMTWGIRRAVLVLPEEARGWSRTRLAAALRHEAGHILRRDYLVRWIAHVACALYWPNPLVWLAARSLRVAQEQATDDLVLRAGTPAKEYAAQLCDAARTVATQGVFARHAVAMATPSTLENRVLAIVDERRDRRPLSRLSAVAGSSIVALALAVCTVAQMRAADPAPAAPSAAAPAAGQSQVLIEVKFMEITGDDPKLDPGLTAEKNVYTDPQYQVILRALNQRKGVDILSAPHVTTRSNQAALIEVVRDFRYPTNWEKNAKAQWEPNAFDNKKVGVTLEVNPVVGADGEIELRLKPSVVEFHGFADLDAPKNAKAPATTTGQDTMAAPNNKRMKPVFSERTIDMTVKLKSGETVALGALKEQADPKTLIKDQVPRRLVIFVSATVITGPTVVDAQEAPAPVQGPAEKAAASIMIPKMEFREATIEEAVAFLRKKSHDLSADGREINIVLKLPKGGEEGRITLDLTNIPLIEAVRYVAGLSNLNLHVQPNALVLGDLAVAETPPAAPSAAEAKADSIIIPRLEFREATPGEAVDFLRKKSRQLDHDKQGVNVVLDLPSSSDARIALSLSNVSLSEALKYVAALADLEIFSEPQAIILRPSKKGAHAGPNPPGNGSAIHDGVVRPTPEAIPVPGKPGFVTSPYEPAKGYIDVRGFPAGTEVKDPYSGKSFLVPPHDGPEAGKAIPPLEQTPKESRIEGRTGGELLPPAAAGIPNAIPVPGKPGFVFSPYAKGKGYIDVRGFPAGTEVKDPYSGNLFLVPPIPAPDAGKATPKPGEGLLQQITPKQSRIEGRAGIEIQSANGAVDLIPTRRHGTFSF